MSNEIPRRNFLSRSLFALATAMAAPSVSFSESFKKAFQSNNSVMNPILSTKPLIPFYFAYTMKTISPMETSKWLQMLNI